MKKAPGLSVAVDSQNAAQQRELLEHYVLRIARDQCRASFAHLFEFFAPRLKSYMQQLGADAGQAEDLVQDVMVSVWRKAGQYDPEKASVSTWIFRIARNRRIDAHRRTRKPELEPDEPLLRPAEPEQPDHLLDRQQMETHVRAEIAKLPPEQLELLKAAFYEGLSHSEIAEAFGLPLGTVKSRIRLAFNRLRGQFDD